MSGALRLGKAVAAGGVILTMQRHGSVHVGKCCCNCISSRHQRWGYLVRYETTEYYCQKPIAVHLEFDFRVSFSTGN